MLSPQQDDNAILFEQELLAELSDPIHLIFCIDVSVFLLSEQLDNVLFMNENIADTGEERKNQRDEASTSPELTVPFPYDFRNNPCSRRSTRTMPRTSPFPAMVPSQGGRLAKKPGGAEATRVPRSTGIPTTR